MDEKFKGRYRIPSIRAQWWDYSNDGAYFITICTADRIPYFGYISNKTMYLSVAGKIANNLWHEIVNHAKNVKLDKFVVMPNHVHGIVIMDGCGDGVVNADIGAVGADINAVNVNMTAVNANIMVETRHALSLHQRLHLQLQSRQQPQSLPSTHPRQNHDHETPGQCRFRNQGKNTVSSIIGGYKSAVSKYCRTIYPDFAWQSRFHDHIVRDNAEYNRIARYIVNNPSKWKTDRFFTKLKHPVLPRECLLP